MNQLTQWFRMLAPREKLVIVVGGILGFAILFWGLIIDPMQSRHTKLQSQIEERERELQWMQHGSARILQARTRPDSSKPVDPRSSRILVDSALSRYKLKEGLKRMRGNREISLNLEKVSADNLMRFLGNLENRHHFTIRKLELKPVNSNGIINANLILTRSQGKT